MQFLVNIAYEEVNKKLSQIFSWIEYVAPERCISEYEYRGEVMKENPHCIITVSA